MRQDLDPPALIDRAEESLEQLAAAINEDHEASSSADLERFRRYRSCGERLIKAKKKVGHGGWEDWVRKELRIHPQRTREYARFAKSPESGDLAVLEAHWRKITNNTTRSEEAGR